MSANFNLSSLVRPNVAKLKPYSSARDEFKDFTAEMVFLDANENPFGNKLNRYPDPQQRDLKTLLAKQKGIEAKQILLGNGSDEVLDLVFRAFCEPAQDAIITMPPTYGMYGVLAAINNVKNKEVLLTSDFDIDTNAVMDAISSDVKLIFVCSPNNPSGNILSKNSITSILKNFEGIVVIDEAYIDFTESESWIHHLSSYPNLIVTQTFSKAYGLAGIRLGVCYASAEIITILNKIKPPYNVNMLTQEQAYNKAKNTIRLAQEIKTLVDERKQLRAALNALPFIAKVYHSDANFLLAKVDNATLRYDQLLKLGVVVRNRSTQPLCENCLRFTVGTKEENEKLIKALKTIRK
jgi:histidinol-phosphate aminotransferase